LSLTQWKEVPEDTFSRNVDGVVKTVFENRPEVELGVPVTYHNLLSETVASFKIQWAYWNRDDYDKEDDELRWFPCDDPDRDGISDHSHFHIDMNNKFGVYFNVAGLDLDNKFGTTGWYSINNNDLIYNYKKTPNRPFVGDERDFYPRALKFTFTIYDSKGVIKNGRTFTHIVYIGE
jgi:hypothetical protein